MDGEKGHVSETMRTGRIIWHTQITDLSNGFQLANAVPFSLLVVPKANVTAGVISAPTNLGLVVSCRMYQDDDFFFFFLYFNTETVAAIMELDIDAIALDTYDVYVGCGSKGQLMEIV